MTTPALRLDAPGAQTFEVDAEARTISGLLLPYGVEATSGGDRFTFSAGSVAYGDPSRVKLWIQHDANRAIGYATALEDRAEPTPGLYGSFKVARGAAGDEALSMAQDRVWDGFSVGIADGGTWEAREGVNHAVSVPLMETSLTPAPAFDDARVHSVAASAARTEGNTMDENTTTEETTPAPSVDFSSITDAIAAGFANLTNPQNVAQTVTAGHALEVTEEAPYRFDGTEAAHDFSTDLIAYGRDRDGEAGERLMQFMGEAFGPRFDISTGDVSSVNPARPRPDLYVDKRDYNTPVYDALYSGAITDMTPFIVPKFSAEGTLVANHTEGTEPTPGDISVTSQTVTPSAVSGKAEITREVWDQGGNPQVSGLLWNRMVKQYQLALEAKAAALLEANAAAITDIALTTAATDDALVSELENALADLQFIAGGPTFSTALTHKDLFKALAGAVDSTGRKLLPRLGATNAAGTTRDRFASLDVDGYEFAPSHSNTAPNSWLVDTEAVHLWNSAPQRLEFQYRVAYVDVGIWGYVASAVTDAAGVRQITYAPA